MGGFVCLGSGQIGFDWGAYGVFNSQHKKSFVYLTADGNPWLCCTLDAFCGVVQRIAQQGGKICVRQGQIFWK